METIFWIVCGSVAVLAVVWSMGHSAGVASLQGRLAQTSDRLRDADDKAAVLGIDLHKTSERVSQLKDLFDATLRQVREDSVLIPSLSRYAESVQFYRDEILVGHLRTKARPARKAAKEVQAACARARNAKKEFEIARNRAELYESIAPWLLEYVDLTLEELLEGLTEDLKVDGGQYEGADPVERYVPKADWGRMDPAERNQLALDRYCDSKRRRTPWAAGIEYERYIGFIYEKKSYRVTYQGATRGRNDFGIDLLCEDDCEILAVQCKRLSVEKQIPVRENVVAQVYGAARFHQMALGGKKPVRPVLITTYELSSEARRFADHLKVDAKQRIEMKPYPMIKCNISRRDGTKIYHLPMDQQYDTVLIEPSEGELYAKTVAEAEEAGFRRAFRWRGSMGDDS